MSGSKVSARLNEALATEILDYIATPRLADFEANFKAMGDINKAHVIMLTEQGILRRDHARALACAILEVEAAGASSVPLDPRLEDTYLNYEAHIISKVGANIGGRMHIARSRNDLASTLDRLRARTILLDVSEALVRIRATALEQADRYAGSVMPGYTHLQPAQPMTYGFYLAGVAQALERDSDRLAETLVRLNVCPLGAAAFGGTMFQINRTRTAELLGFESYIDNTLDAVASRDFILESLTELSLLAILWSRVAQDYHVWSTHEFGLIEFPDSISSTSSIMPQKKNPVVLEYLKGRSGPTVSALVGAMIGIKGTHFTHSGESSRAAISGFWSTSSDVMRCLALFELVLRSARPLTVRAQRQAAEDFSTATALADLLVRDHDFSFREAHHVVGAVVRSAMDRGISADRIDVKMIEAAAIAQLGRPLAIDPDAVQSCLDPVSNVTARCSAGGPSPDIVRAHVAEAEGRLLTARALLESGREREARASESLRYEICKLAAA